MTKQEIERAIENGDKLWFYEHDNDCDDWGVVEVDTKYFRWSNNENCYTHFNKETWKSDPKPYKMYNDCLFKTKEDAEFVAKMWCDRVERFEPPLYDEFLKEDYVILNPYSCFSEQMSILRHANTLVLGYDLRIKDGVYGFASGTLKIYPNTKENYIKAVEYARELFKGETV